MINLRLVGEQIMGEKRARVILNKQHQIDELALEWFYHQDEATRKRIKRRVEELEFDLQGLWGFPLDRDMHTHWKRFPGLYKKRGRRIMTVTAGG